MPFIAQSFMCNVTKALLSTPSGFEMAVKKIGLGVYIYPRPLSQDKG
jgi:hypothetical protein